jgi:hypothetical protein
MKVQMKKSLSQIFPVVFLLLFFVAPSYAQSKAGDTTETILIGTLSPESTTIGVVSTDGFPESGLLKIDDEVIPYASKTGTEFNGCTRDAGAATHENNVAVKLVKGSAAQGVTVEGNISEIGSVTINADSDLNGIGGVDIQTRNLSRLNIGNNGGLGVGVPGDYGLLSNQAMLSFKGFEAKRYNIWKAWSSDPTTPTAANFTFFGNLGPNPTGTRGMQGYYMGTNVGRAGVEFPNEGQFLDGWETYWTGGPNAPAQERWTYIRGAAGTSAQRVMFYYSPLYNPERTSLEWALNQISFGDWKNRRTWMSFSPGKISMITTPEAPIPQIVTDSASPLIYKGTQSYPFVNGVGETEVSRDTQIVRFMSKHDTISPSADYQFVLGAGINRPGLRFNVSGGRGWEYSNDGKTYTKFADATKGSYRQFYNLAAAAGSFTMIGTAGPNVSGETPLAFTVTVSENNRVNAVAARVYHVLLPLYGTQNVWKEVLPTSAAISPGTDTNLKLDVKTDAVDGLTKLRLRRSAAVASASTAYVDVQVFDRTGAFTLSTQVGVGATVADTLQTLSASTRVQTLVVDYGGGVTDTKGAGAPSGACVTGSTYRDVNGTVGATFFVCVAKTWAAK